MGRKAVEGPRRGLTITQASKYVGVTPKTFRKLMAERRMPQPKLIGSSKRVWDIRQIDACFDECPDDESKPSERSPARPRRKPSPP